MRTSAGALVAHIQIVGPGAGEGRVALEAALKEAAANGWSAWGIVHDLRSSVRNCGCSRGSLGGAGILASLPALAAHLAPAVQSHWALTGDVDAVRPGLGAALGRRGWTVNDAAIAVTADPLSRLADPALVVVIPTVPVPVEHRKILRPALPEGMAVDLLLVDGQSQVRARRVVPVDRTLDDDPEFAKSFPDPLTAVVTAVEPSQSCRECHVAAVDHWAGTRHAQAYARLPEADRTDVCIQCHTLPLAGKAVAPGVHCQSCHTGADAHAAARGVARTSGTVDCRSCHDARHHAGFDRDRLWETIRHGR